jgi:hypothetical protein
MKPITIVAFLLLWTQSALADEDLDKFLDVPHWACSELQQAWDDRGNSKRMALASSWLRGFRDGIGSPLGKNSRRMQVVANTDMNQLVPAIIFYCSRFPGSSVGEATAKVVQFILQGHAVRDLLKESP